ncbi:hypothetical protein [Rickettsiella grylli]|uniref:hypothetical protein n=1 Tax=Rickettsiella grylli TaxID=59196 RepID=UPI001FCFFC3F|nr:hypothetical protein [Rickettsiella grylli]
MFPNSSLKGYLGSYYFSPAETNNVWGGAAGLEYWLTQGVKLVGSYSYDNLHHSTYAFGIGLEWGGLEPIVPIQRLKSGSPTRLSAM